MTSIDHPSPDVHKPTITTKHQKGKKLNSIQLKSLSYHAIKTHQTIIIIIMPRGAEYDNGVPQSDNPIEVIPGDHKAHGTNPGSDVDRSYKAAALPEDRRRWGRGRGEERWGILKFLSLSRSSSLGKQMMGLGYGVCVLSIHEM
ncbi:hypothetical protein VTN49DRAFT_7204 [Thermomyces lanuginosus]|uniref:uncharacterized protein n=1 Tax=Thermomyces lanuginosus TaxID=5541 RepID=UPI0037426164